MPKKVKTVLKLNLPAGTATPAPPVGPILGQAGINMMDFLKQYNDKTSDKKGQVIPAELTVYDNGSFDFVLKLPPVSDFIKRAIKLKKGSQEAGRKNVGKISKDQVKKIAEEKMSDLNTNNLEAAIKTVEGSARSMGVEVI
jgi:large subunit ribosomal protein L11